MTLEQRQARIAELKAIYEAKYQGALTCTKEWTEEALAILKELAELDAPMKGTHGLDFIVKERQNSLKFADWKSDMKSPYLVESEPLSQLAVLVKENANMAIRHIQKGEPRLAIDALARCGSFAAREIDRLTLDGVE